MSTQARLEAYGFSPEVIAPVVEFAEEVATHTTYQETFDRFGIPEPKVVQYGGYFPHEVIDILPANCDPKAAMVVHLAMANPLNENQRYQLAAIAATNPNTRIIAAGNPGSPGNKLGRLTREQRVQVAKGDLRPVIASVEKYAVEQGIDLTDQVGYSYGADRAVTAAASDAYDVRTLTAIESVAVKKRTPLALGKDFAAVAEHLEAYVKDSDAPGFEDARTKEPGLAAYGMGVLRLSNLAIARALTHNMFEDRARKAMDLHDRLHTTMVWGSESELAIDAPTQEVADRLTATYGVERVLPLRIEGGKHVMVNDIHLQAAMVLVGSQRVL